MKQEPTRWEATTTPGLYVRQPGGGFYARITLNGKRSWRSLKTDKLRTAQKLLRDLQSGHTRQVSTRSDDKLHAAMAAVIEFRGIRRTLKSKQLRKSTTAYHGEILASAKKLLPDHPLAMFDTVGILKAIQGSELSQSRRKAIFELVKRTFATAVENGVIQKNPLAGHIPGKVERKERSLPTREQLDEIMRVIPELYPRYGHRAVLTLRFLAFSGMRLSEARSVTWDDITDGKIRIRGGEEGLKTKDAGQSRLLDINQPLQSVLDDIQGLYGKLDRVMPAKGIRPHLKAACDALKIPVIDHHDLRAWFITLGIVSGVDIKTLADWVGNSPTVLLERYAMVQDEIKKSAASKLQ
jgi:integrase